MSSVVHTYNDIISVENLFAAWQEFLRGKRKKHDVQEFGNNLMDNVLTLSRELKNKTYTHGDGSFSFVRILREQESYAYSMGIEMRY